MNHTQVHRIDWSTANSVAMWRAYRPPSNAIAVQSCCIAVYFSLIMNLLVSSQQIYSVRCYTTTRDIVVLLTSLVLHMNFSQTKVILWREFFYLKFFFFFFKLFSPGSSLSISSCWGGTIIYCGTHPRLSSLHTWNSVSSSRHYVNNSCRRKKGFKHEWDGRLSSHLVAKREGRAVITTTSSCIMSRCGNNLRKPECESIVVELVVEQPNFSISSIIITVGLEPVNRVN